MRVLLISATRKEIDPLLSTLEQAGSRITKLGYYKYKNLSVDILIPGIGSPATVYHLVQKTKHIHYKLVLNAGLAGSFTKDIKSGEVVNVIKDQFADIGIEDNDTFLTIFECGLEDPDTFPFKNGVLKNPANLTIPAIDKLRKVQGITTNTAHGNQQSIQKIHKKYNADIETMEGAAVFYTCLMEKIPFYEIRAISNYIEHRNTQQWNITEAVKNLHSTILTIFEDLNAIV